MVAVAADQLTAPVSARPTTRTPGRWVGATLALTLAPMAAAVLLAPPAGTRPGTALVWLLFVGSSGHVGATAWFYTVPEVRAHMGRHRGRYVWAPVLLIAVTAAAVVVVPRELIVDGLLAYFGWQFFHFQKQNLGIAALAARGLRVSGLSRTERRAMVAAGCGGVVALVAHPELLQLSPGVSLRWLYDGGLALFVVAAAVGVWALLRRSPDHRPAGFVTVYAVSLLFFAPVFVFSSPYAAVAGITIAHGLQYLLLVGMLAGGPNPRATPPQLGVLILVNVALVVGLGLNLASHMHTAEGLTRSIYGAYLGLVMAHFVVDAGLWRMRDEFPRRFLTQRLPSLLAG